MKRIRLFVDTDAVMRAAVNMRAIRMGVKPKDLLLSILQKEFAKELKEAEKYPVAHEEEQE